MTSKTARFADLLITPLRSGVTIPKGNRGTGIKMINMGELFRYPRIPDTEMALVDFDYRNEERFLVQPGDLLFARRSLTAEGAGKCAIVLDAPTPRTWESSIIRARLNRDKADPDYYFYMFQAPYGRNLIGGIVEQVAVAGIRSSDLANLRVPWPELAEQRAISSVLRALDDKAAANDRLTASSDQYCAALLQDIVVTGCGKPVKLGDIATVNAASIKPIPGASLRYIDISSVADGRIDWPAASSWDTAPGRARRKVSVGDTIWSTVRPNRCSRALILDDDPLLVASTGFAVLTPRAVGPAFLYECARRNDFVAYLESVAEGSAYPAVRADRFLAAPIPNITAEKREKFESIAFNVRLRAHSSVHENRVLAELRDVLAAELMSGRLRVKDAEKVVEEAV
ncbi:restriction endonuclease subunit S [Winogradskya consettensis]|uniref:Specificity protein S n=1 Tax=Winogradskya consettensis TaxID=113560 RepID=A0A919ST49_9ACTN|nr:restriction endonuclease subunit S [Actinoplanes consettensis]GIM77119.1 specificity protein S [Actinoplanes consettensis]